MAGRGGIDDLTGSDVCIVRSFFLHLKVYGLQTFGHANISNILFEKISFGTSNRSKLILTVLEI